MIFCIIHILYLLTIFKHSNTKYCDLYLFKPLKTCSKLGPKLQEKEDEFTKKYKKAFIRIQTKNVDFLKNII